MCIPIFILRNPCAQNCRAYNSGRPLPPQGPAAHPTQLWDELGLTLMYTPQKDVDTASAASAESTDTTTTLSGSGFSELDTSPTPTIDWPGRYQRPALSDPPAKGRTSVITHTGAYHSTPWLMIASIAPPALHEAQPRFNFSGEVIWTSPLA